MTLPLDALTGRPDPVIDLGPDPVTAADVAQRLTDVIAAGAVRSELRILAGASLDLEQNGPTIRVFNDAGRQVHPFVTLQPGDRLLGVLVV